MTHYWKYTHSTQGERNGIRQEIYHYECMDCGKKKTKTSYTPAQAHKMIQEEIAPLIAEYKANREKVSVN